MGANQIVLVKKEIRRALERPLFDMVEAQSPKIPVQWPGLAFDRVVATRDMPVPSYIATEVNWGTVQITEMGPAPRFVGNGALTMVIRTAATFGADPNDDLAALIANAYPYNLESVFQGVTVHIDKMQSGAYGIEGAWLTALVAVDWTCYRR